MREEYYQEAEKHYLLSRKYDSEANDLITLSNLGAMYYITNRLEDAKKIFKEAICSFEEKRATLTDFDQKRFDGKYATIFEYATAIETKQGNFLAGLKHIEKLKGREYNANFSENLFTNDDVFLPELAKDEVILYFVNTHHNTPLAFCLTREGVTGKFLVPDVLLDGIEPFQDKIGQKFGMNVQKSRTEQQTAFEMIPHPGSFDAVVLYYNSRLTQDNRFWQIKKQKTKELSQALYQYLIAPFEEIVNSKNKVIIIPDRALNLMPFETLIDDTGKYLIENVSISYLSNLSQYDLLKQRKYIFEKDCLRIGVDDYPALVLDDKVVSDSLPTLSRQAKTAIKNKENTDAFYAKLGVKKWVNLKYVKEELNQISSIFPKSESLIGASANPDKIEELSRDNHLTQYKLIHFANHGLSVPSVPELSALVLHNNADGNRYLHSMAIKKLRIKADLVCLSACETGLGELISSIGIIGLPYAFLSAGAKSILVSLWSIDDQNTCAFIREFYSIYSATKNYSFALATVKRRCIKGDLGEKLRNPLYWAAFTLIGVSQEM